MSRKTTVNFTLSPLLRLLLIVALVPALASCATYYYPAVERADGVYYAADDPVYVDHVADFAGVRYYPWWSVDYFYLGYGQRYGNWSVGASYGSPWYPYRPWWGRSHFYSSWHYDPWYASYWYAPYYRNHPWRGYAWYQPYWHTRYRHYHGGHAYRGHRGGYGYGGRDHHGNRGSYAGYRGRHEDGRPVPGQGADPYRGASRTGKRSTPGTGAAVRRVSVAPDGRGNDRGMVISNRDGGKWSRSRLEPVGPVRNTGVSRGGRPEPVRGNERASDPETTRRGNTVVRYRGSAKIRPSRTDPVGAPTDSRRVRAADSDSSSRARATYQSRNGDGTTTVRRNLRTKVAPQRLQPRQPSRVATPPRVTAIPVPKVGRTPDRPVLPRGSAPVRGAPPRVQPVERPRAAPARASAPPPARTVQRSTQPPGPRAENGGKGQGSRSKEIRSKGAKRR